jgi:hypothetical protein
MDTNELKLYLGHVVTESSMPKDAKIQMLNFLRDANDIQLKAIYLDGEIIKPTVSEQAKQIIEQRFSVSEGVWRSVLGALVLGPIWVLYRGIRAELQDKSRKCGTYKISSERVACLAHATIWESKEMLKLMGKAKGDCNKAKNPEKCRKSVDKAVSRLKNKIGKSEEILRKLSMKGKGVARGKEMASRKTVDMG